MIAHINNLYNTAFWSLVQQGGQTTTEAHATLRVSSFELSFFLYFMTHISPREHFRKINMKFFTLSLGLTITN